MVQEPGGGRNLKPNKDKINNYKHSGIVWVKSQVEVGI